MKDMSQRLRRRSRLLRLTLTIALIGVVTRMFYLHTVEGATLSKEAESMWTDDKMIPAVRGTIFDRNNVKLAYTAKAYIVYVDPSQMKDDAGMDHSKMVADLLAPILHVPATQYSTLENMLSSGVKGWMKVAPWGNLIDQEQHDQIIALQAKMQRQYDGFVPGIYFDTTSQRVYPNGNFASHVLGFVNANGDGGTGVEEEYQNVLKGHDGKEKYLADAAGNPLPYGQIVSKPVQNGDNVQLTIDSTIQHYVEVALDEGMKKYKPYRASIIVTDPNTGAVLAMGNRPSFDPNHYADANQNVLYQNWAVNSTFEPGSTFKIVTLTAALDQHKINLSDQYNSGTMMVDGSLVHDWNWDGVHAGWGKITYHDAFIHSSNVGFAKIALKLGAPLLYSYIDKFGFDQPTGIDLPGEADSLLFPVSTILPIELATTGYGQGISVTPIQQIAAVGAVANGGRLLRPYIVREIMNSDTGKIISKTNPQVHSIVASPQTMKAVRQMMEDEVNSDREAYIPGYDVAGKTGTASIPKPGGGYMDNQNRYITSFIGFAPAQHPVVEIYVTLDTPKTDLAYGSTVAGPLAKQVLEQVLPYMHVPIDTSQLQSKEGSDPSSNYTMAGSSASAQQVQYTTVPNIVDASKSTAGSILKTAGLSPEWVGSGTQVTRQWPEAGLSVVSGGRVIVMVGDGRDASGKVIMPDLSGFSMREATNMMMALGLSMTLNGDGFVSSQSEPAGTLLAPGAAVRLTFSAH